MYSKKGPFRKLQQPVTILKQMVTIDPATEHEDKFFVADETFYALVSLQDSSETYSEERDYTYSRKALTAFTRVGITSKDRVLLQKYDINGLPDGQEEWIVDGVHSTYRAATSSRKIITRINVHKEEG